MKKTEVSMRTKEIEENKRYLILSRALTIGLSRIGFECDIDIIRNDEMININMRKVK